jgi:cyanophycin synthetase
MIRIQIDLGALETYPTNTLPGFADRLLELLPGLQEHGCSAGHPGGLVERLRAGTWLGHVIEHVALELQCRCGDEVTRGKTRSVNGKPGEYNVMYAYCDEQVGLVAGRLAVELVLSLLEPPLNQVEGLDHIIPRKKTAFEFTAEEAALVRLSQQRRLGPSTAALVAEARRRGIPWERMDQHSLIRLGTGAFQRRIRASIGSSTSHLGVETASNKDLTKQLLSEIAVPVPKGRLVRTLEGAKEASEELGWPVTIKPLDANHGRGVTTNIRSEAELNEAFIRAKALAGRVIVEQHLHGRDYRLLVVSGRLVAAAERQPAQVMGDGCATIEALVAKVNHDPRRGEGHQSILTKIVLDEVTDAILRGQGLARDSVLAEGQIAQLRGTANLSSGGSAVDCTDLVHRDNAAAAVRAARAIGLDIAGVDFIHPDISRSWHETGGGIVEVNAAPGLRMHLAPSEGQARVVARPILRTLFPRGSQYTIPTVAITGTNGKSTTVRMVASILRRRYDTVGLTSTSGVYRNDELLWKGDASGPKSAKLLLRDPSVEAVVLETARGGILREGLPFDVCDVGAVLNVSADHLGIGGVDTVAELAQVKSVVTESVRRGGTSILNADDPSTPTLARHAGGQLSLFSMRGREGVLEHLAMGRSCVVYDEASDELRIERAFEHTPIMKAKELPATLGGVARFNIENALAAAAIALALGLSLDEVRSGLRQFHTTYEDNPGRMNVYDRHGFRVIMDYAHNPAAMHALLRLLRDMRRDFKRVIGSVSTPGDRRTEDIKEMGRIAAHDFDLLVFRELPDNRGRPANEVIRLLREGAVEAGANPDKIVCVRAEEEAAAICLRAAQPGDIVVLLPTKVDACWQQVLNFVPQWQNTEVPQ